MEKQIDRDLRQCENIVLKRHFIFFFLSLLLAVPLPESALKRFLTLSFKDVIFRMSRLLCKYIFNVHVFFFINIVCVKHRTTDMFENVSCSLSKCGKWSLKHFLLLNFAATCCRCWFSNHLLCIWCFSVFLIIGSYFASCMKADM